MKELSEYEGRHFVFRRDSEGGGRMQVSGKACERTNKTQKRHNEITKCNVSLRLKILIDKLWF